ncbi:UDP-N-acetylmuramate--L-alanine ligase [bacterium]|nr:MAG: UDP-N-acetylmuramate--L-alanine ligase [bacterium]
MYKKIEIIYFVGIGGVGMSGIAEVLKNLGYEVRGSDLKESEITGRLRSMGITVNKGHRAENIHDAHVVVVSSAVSEDNPEVKAARERSIPVIPRAEMLSELARLKYGVLIAGAHGKTTTTSLIASVFASVGIDPTVVIGGKLKGVGSHAILGQGDFLVAEADESDGSFLKLSPTIAVVTNIDREHMDFFGTVEELKKAFLSFINKVPFYGMAIICTDSEHVKELLPKIQRRVITYGLVSECDLRARNITVDGVKSGFEAIFRGKSLGYFEVPLPGSHNVCNSLAAIAAAQELDIDGEKIREALRSFSGIQRRLEFKGEASGVRVYDDYGHHPTEIIVTLRAAKEAMGQERETAKGRLFVLFQPHRYTRTRDLLYEFFGAFEGADKVILMDIYSAGERALSGINSKILQEGMKERGADVAYIKEREEILDYLKQELETGDILLTLGAGDVWEIGEEYLNTKNKSRKKGENLEDPSQ